MNMALPSPCMKAVRPQRRICASSNAFAHHRAAYRAFRCQAAASFVPPQVKDIVEPAAQTMISKLTRTPVPIPTLDRTLDTAFVGPTTEQLAAYPAQVPAIILLHGFDSSCLEFRRLYPLLSQHAPTYAVDLVGWGFTDASPFSQDQSLPVRPLDKREHLASFWQEKLNGRPLVVVGASLGGAVALDFAYHHPEAVSRLVMLDAQVFVDGIGPMATLPRFFAELGVKVLKTEWLRDTANQMSYFNKEKYATQDAMRIGRLHTFLPGWLDANVAFMRSGGYSVSSLVGKVQEKTQILVLWGRNDKILEKKDAERWQSSLTNGQFVWVEECGHVPHLEQPQFTAQQILQFAGVSAEATEKTVMNTAA